MVDFIKKFFSKFARNMMFIHLSVAALFFILWMLEMHGLYKTHVGELTFGIGAICYGLFLIGYYVYTKHH